MIETERFTRAAYMFLNNMVSLEHRGFRNIYLKVFKYEVKLGRTLDCTCVYGSCYGIKREMDCAHTIASIFYLGLAPLIKRDEIKILIKKKGKFIELKPRWNDEIRGN